MNKRGTLIALLVTLAAIVLGCAAQPDPSDPNDPETMTQDPSAAELAAGAAARGGPAGTGPDRRVNILRKLGKVGARRAPRPAGPPEQTPAPQAQ
jgi:hypothetical protein